ncbi:glutamate receptor ionotropic, kainate 4 [Amblyraja radiata]|uniref:glutamate receptor ionotropic, kainate 4 n=1 Tax=Amblyraja radiata TaxID=386614 RepID=UPI001401F383|nr:glutamate receptor ionotropic, kainate 4 [Amblyraja radiata]XP_032905467.1 glutamate receptor ionotropic, kainate 4 [Amblyraja radiata]
MLHLLILLMFLSLRKSSEFPNSVRMAAILDDPMECSRGERLAISLAKTHINNIVDTSEKARLEVDLFELLRDSEYETADTTCQILPKGVVAILGPSSSPASASIISHICGEKEVPHVKVAPEEIPKSQYLRFTSLNLHPTNTDVSLAIASILNFFNRTMACLICAKAECLLSLEKLLRQFLISKDTLSVRMLDQNQDSTPLLKEIRDDKIATIIIDASASVSQSILRKAVELGMTSTYYNYIFTSLEFPLLHFEGLIEEHVNILGFSITNQDHPYYNDFVHSLNKSWQENCAHSPYSGAALSSALLFDAVFVIVTAVNELNRSQEIAVKSLSCGSAQIWQHGTSLMNYLRMVELEGLTGHVEFNSKGQRTNYILKIVQRSKEGLKQVGFWHSEKGLVMDRKYYFLNASESLFNKTLIVTTILENPYVMLKPNHQELQGNGQYEGFCVDMLKELSEILRFHYKIQLVADGVYGVAETNGTWTGMIGELISRKADLAVAGLTITAEREKVIDFSKPFMTLGISILYRVQMGRKPGYFSFLDPFSPGVWLFMVLAYLAVSCVLFLVARLSPYEWYNPQPCFKGKCNVLVNQYSLGNSLWFPVGGFMQQGSEIMPRAVSTRCVSGVWWAFTLIIISSYTANLAAFLTVQRMDVPIESVDDLADQTNIEYGTIQRGSSMTFFQNSRYQTYQRMWNYMHSKQPSVFVKSTEEGISRVLNSNYAFLLESTMNEYHRQRNCNLTQIGGLLDTKGYGIGLPLASLFRNEFDLAILQLQENNRLEMLKRKWWEGGKCPKEGEHGAKGLGMENIGGIFVVLICGLIVAVVTAVIEFMWTMRHSTETEISVCQEMLKELRSIVSCHESIRSRRKRRLIRTRFNQTETSRDVNTMSLSNGKLCSGTMPDPVSQRLAHEAALAVRGCTHIHVCPECRRFQGMRPRPMESPIQSEESLEWEKATSNSSDQEQ